MSAEVASSWVLSASAGRMWSALGGFVDELTGVGALWSRWSLLQTATKEKKTKKQQKTFAENLHGETGYKKSPGTCASCFQPARAKLHRIFIMVNRRRAALQFHQTNTGEKKSMLILAFLSFMSY